MDETLIVSMQHRAKMRNGNMLGISVAEPRKNTPHRVISSIHHPTQPSRLDNPMSDQHAFLKQLHDTPL